jgi:NADH:ubiquinone oxidoreductase subunit 6 (subunit J)
MKLGKWGQGVLSPAMIMSIVVSLIILIVGIYAFYTTTSQLDTTGNVQAASAVNNTSAVGSQVFNVVGIVLVIGAIMLIVTMVYSFMRR